MNNGQYEQSPKVAPTVAEVVSKTTDTVVPDDYATPIPHDEKRIDFLEAHPELRIVKRKKYWSVGTFSNYERDVHKTLREAIDEAMLKGEK